MLRTRINDDLKAAMKAKDQCKVSTLRLVLAALKDRDIAAREHGAEAEIGEQEIVDLLTKMVRQRRESINLYEQGGRLDLAEREAQEIGVIEDYLPAQMNDDEVSDAVRAVISDIGAVSIKDMGRTMATLKKSYGGRMDFAKANAIVKTYLAGAAQG